MTQKPDNSRQTAYPPRGGGWLGVPRAFAAYALLACQLVLVMFVFEVPMHLADRFLARRRGHVFAAMQRHIARWFFRLYPFGSLRRIGRLPSGAAVLVCNHQSRLDLLAALALGSNARWLAPRWMFKLPLMGELFKLGKHLEASTGDSGLAQARELLDEGTSILAFPEGRRSRRGAIAPLRGGLFQLAIDAGKPVVPVVIEGTGAALQKGDLGMRAPRVTLRVLDAIETGPYKGEGGAERLRRDVRAKMASALDELRQSSRRLAMPNGLVTRAALGLAALAVAALIGVAVYVQSACIASPPPYSGSRTLASKSMGRFGEARTLGDNWTRVRNGVTEVALSGNSWERGYASAKFTPEQLKEQEDHLLKTVNEFLPWPRGPVRWLLKQGIGVNNRRLPEYVSEEEKLEILGLVEGSVDHHPDDVPLYHRVLNYHAAHDISHMLIDNPLVVKRDLVGCTGFAVWGPATQDGGLLLARNFDWEAGEVFDRSKVIFYVWPEKGLPYVHVAWSGMAGAVTGMNARGIAVSLNAARTDDSGRFGTIGTPVSLLVKRVLNEAESIEQAVKIIRDTPVFVSDSYLVASAREKRAVVVEKSPGRCAVREASREGVILQANHFEHADYREDQANAEHMARATTLYRHGRLKELVDESYGKFQTGTCLGILRDRKGKGGKDIGLGNRNAIDAFICTHSVVMDVTAGVMWVSSGPNTVGGYVRVDVQRMLDAKPQGALRMVYHEDENMPRDMEYYYKILDVIEFRKQLKAAREALEEEDAAKLKPIVKSMENMNPTGFETSYFQGRLAMLEKRPAEARKKFDEALSRDPHYEDVREEIRAWLLKASE